LPSKSTPPGPRADPPGRRRLGGLRVGRAGADGRGAADGRRLHVRPFDLWVARPFIKAKYISLVNLLADAEVMPEYLTPVDASADLARWALTWLDDPSARRRASDALAELRDRVAVPGASERAADRVAEVVRAAYPAPAVPPRPHHPIPKPSRNGKHKPQAESRYTDR
jgi:hypothetical protein